MHGSLNPIDDHLPERSLDDIWVFLNCRGITLKGLMICKLVLVYLELSEY
jgi:hypothetical protein